MNFNHLSHISTNIVHFTGKSVQWALDSTGEPRVDIIDCQYDDTDSIEEPANDTSKEYEQKELRYAV